MNQVSSVNTYDPADFIHYVHMVQVQDPWSVPVESSQRVSRPPVRYADESPHTSLRNRRPRSEKIARTTVPSRVPPAPEIARAGSARASAIRTADAVA
jgi:hypothetical protein